MQTNARIDPGDVAIAGGGRPYTALAALAHALIWSVVPALVIGNMHQDTLEAAYWGGDLALGYPEHPPLLSWVIGLALRIGHAPIFTLLLISQAGMVVAAAYVWRTARLYASRGAAAMAVMLTLISPAATVYGVQVNHNSFLAPFWAAALFYGLAYLEGGRWRDATLFAVATGLGLLVKYEMAFIVVCLLGLALAVPRFRAAFRRPATYFAILVVGAIVAPHVAWLAQNGGPSVFHALGRHRMTEAGALAASAGNALVGLFVLFAVPAVVLFVANARGGAAAWPTWRSERGTIGAALAFGPFLVMLIGVVATFQIAKPLWTTPMTSSSAVGLMLLFPPRGERRARRSQGHRAAVGRRDGRISRLSLHRRRRHRLAWRADGELRRRFQKTRRGRRGFLAGAYERAARMHRHRRTRARPFAGSVDSQPSPLRGLHPRVLVDAEPHRAMPKEAAASSFSPTVPASKPSSTVSPPPAARRVCRSPSRPRSASAAPHGRSN